MKWQRKNAVPMEKARSLGMKELEGKMIIGVLVDKEAPAYHEYSMKDL